MHVKLEPALAVGVVRPAWLVLEFSADLGFPCIHTDIFRPVGHRRVDHRAEIVARGHRVAAHGRVVPGDVFSCRVQVDRGWGGNGLVWGDSGVFQGRVVHLHKQRVGDPSLPQMSTLYTAYAPDVVTSMLWLSSPVDQMKLFALDAVKVNMPPSHKLTSPSTAMVGTLPTISVTVSRLLKPAQLRRRKRAQSTRRLQTPRSLASPPRWTTRRKRSPPAQSTSPIPLGRSPLHWLSQSRPPCKALPGRCGTGQSQGCQSPFPTRLAT